MMNAKGSTGALGSGIRRISFGECSPLANLDPTSQVALTALAAERTAIFGDSRRTYTKRLVACHEAGHVIAHQLCSLRPTEARIWRDPSTRQWYGCSDYSAPSTGHFLALDKPELAIALAFEWLAGWCGEAVFGGIVDPGSSADEAVAADAALEGAAFGLSLPFQILGLTLRTYLVTQLHTHRTAGEIIARQLQREHKIR
jgi:hypothetical protein